MTRPMATSVGIPPLRIMFLYMFPLYGNGSSAWLRALIRELQAHGHKIALVSPDERKLPGVKSYVVRPPQMGVFVGNPELPEVKKFEVMSGVELTEIYTAYLQATIPAVKEFQPEIIHAFHTVFLPPVARIAKILYGTKFIITTHGSDLHYLSRDRRLVGLIRDAVRVSSLVTANSGFTRTWFLDMFGHEWAKKIRTIPGGVEIEQYSGKARNLSVIDREFGLAGKKVALFTGRLTEHKGVEYLVKAARQIKGEVLILGDGPERPYLEKMIVDYDLKNTRILGYMNPKERSYFKDFYARADVYVAPSTWDEPLGLVILEAMAARTPVIVTRKGGFTSLVKDGVTGFFVRPHNSSQIAEKVNTLFENPELAKKMGDKAHQLVQSRYTWSQIARKFERMYGNNRSSTSEYLKFIKVPNRKS